MCLSYKLHILLAYKRPVKIHLICALGCKHVGKICLSFQGPNTSITANGNNALQSAVVSRCVWKGLQSHTGVVAVSRWNSNRRGMKETTDSFKLHSPVPSYILNNVNKTDIFLSKNARRMRCLNSNP